MDVDEDGREDVIFGMVKAALNNAGDKTLESMKKTCADAGKYFTDILIFG